MTQTSLKKVIESYRESLNAVEDKYPVQHDACENAIGFIEYSLGSIYDDAEVSE